MIRARPARSVCTPWPRTIPQNTMAQVTSIERGSSGSMKWYRGARETPEKRRDPGGASAYAAGLQNANVHEPPRPQGRPARACHSWRAVPARLTAIGTSPGRNPWPPPSVVPSCLRSPMDYGCPPHAGDPPPSASTPGVLRPSTYRATSRAPGPWSIPLLERKTTGKCDTGWWSEGNDDLKGRLPPRPTGRWTRTRVVPGARLDPHKPSPPEACTDLPPSCC